MVIMFVYRFEYDNFNAVNFFACQFCRLRMFKKPRMRGRERNDGI